MVDELVSYTSPPPRPESSNLRRHAWDELNRAGLFTEDGDFYGGMTGRAVMELIDLFAEQGHSGTSAGIVADLFVRLALFGPLGPLTDDPGEWCEVGDGLWQNRRDSAAFSRDGGKTYSRNGEPGVTHTSEPHDG